MEANTLESLDEKDVVPFLKEKLAWKLFSVSVGCSRYLQRRQALANCESG
jgi:hypothetical protein